jgi:hypothetical protein
MSPKGLETVLSNYLLPTVLSNYPLPIPCCWQRSFNPKLAATYLHQVGLQRQQLHSTLERQRTILSPIKASGKLATVKRQVTFSSIGSIGTGGRECKSKLHGPRDDRNDRDNQFDPPHKRVPGIRMCCFTRRYFLDPDRSLFGNSRDVQQPERSEQQGPGRGSPREVGRAYEGVWFGGVLPRDFFLDSRWILANRNFL